MTINKCSNQTSSHDLHNTTNLNICNSVKTFNANYSNILLPSIKYCFATRIKRTLSNWELQPNV